MRDHARSSERARQPVPERGRPDCPGEGQVDRGGGPEGMDISPGTLGNWVAKDRIDRGEAEGLSAEERCEFAHRRSDNAVLRREHDALQQSMFPWGEEGDEVTLASFIASQVTDFSAPDAMAYRRST